MFISNLALFNCFDHRLFLSGSSALPESVFQKWNELTGFEIVEQFGSSETGRVLSNKLDGKKIAGSTIISISNVYKKMLS